MEKSTAKECFDYGFLLQAWEHVASKLAESKALIDVKPGTEKLKIGGQSVKATRGEQWQDGPGLFGVQGIW